jgi:hypothetical protein
LRDRVRSRLAATATDEGSLRVNANERHKDRRKLPPAFLGEAQAHPDQEEQGEPTALAIAIAQAAKEAATHLHENDMSETEFEVSRIQVTVAPNPGPTSYKVTITPSG